MKERFRRMEGVGGLHAIVAFSREDGSLVYCSEGLNADFSSEVAFRIRSEIEAAPAAVQRIVFTLGQERVIIVPSGDHFLALHVNQQFDINALRDRLLQEAPVRRTAARAGDVGRHVADEDLELLVSALTTICRPALDELGVFVVVNALRKTRDALLRKHRCLSNFSIEKGGTLSHGNPPDCKLSDMVCAAAEWAMDFYNHCNGIVPTFPPSLAVTLLDSNADRLEEIGFFDAFDAATR
jgi:hypothetical protein